MKHYTLSLIGLALATSVYLVTFFLKIDLFEAVIAIFHGLEAYEIDEFVIPLLILFMFIFADQMRRLQYQRLDHEKVIIYKAMMSSTHHVLNNFLNQIQLFKMTAEATPGFDPEVLALYNNVVDDAITQIGALGSITLINESTIRDSVAPKPSE